MLSFEQVVSAINRVDAVVAHLIAIGRREEILNERYFHHMFSSYLASLNTFEQTWNNLFIYPEYPTNLIFLRNQIQLDNPDYTQEHALGAGIRGNLDFIIPRDPPNSPISVEWKGPKNCPGRDLAEVFIKLLSQNIKEDKILAAIFLTKRGNRNHAANLIEKLGRSLQFACAVLGINDLQDQNLYVYIRSRFEGGYHPIWWGQVIDVDFNQP